MPEADRRAAGPGLRLGSELLLGAGGGAAAAAADDRNDAQSQDQGNQNALHRKDSSKSVATQKKSERVSESGLAESRISQTVGEFGAASPASSCVRNSFRSHGLQELSRANRRPPVSPRTHRYGPGKLIPGKNYNSQVALQGEELLFMPHLLRRIRPNKTNGSHPRE